MIQKPLSQKILAAIENDRLKLEPWKKSWYSYILDIYELVWSRNLVDGYDIHVCDTDMSYITTVRI